MVLLPYFGIIWCCYAILKNGPFYKPTLSFSPKQVHHINFHFEDYPPISNYF